MAGGRIKGITIEIDGNTTKLQSALSGVDKSLRNTQTKLRDVNKLLKFDPTSTTLLKQKHEALKKTVADTKEKLDKEKQALAQLKEADQTPEVKAQMEALERQIAEDEQGLKSAQKELKSFGSVGAQQIKAVGAAVKAAGEKIKEVGGKIQAVGKEITTKVTVPLVAIGGASIKAFTDVDKGLDTIIQKTGATGEAAEEMKGIMEGIATSIPTDFETAGAAIGEVSTRFGVTGQELEQLSTKFVKFAKLNNTDVSGSVDKVQKALSAYGLGAEDAGAYLDRLNKTGQDTGVSVDSLAEGIVSNSAAFQQMGLSIDDATILMGQLEKSGVNSETVLNGMRKALKKATEDGIPLNQALSELQGTIENGSGSVDGLTASYELFGKSGDQIYAAVKSGAINFEDLGIAAEESGGNIDSTFAATQDTTDKFKTTLNQLKITGAELGTTLLSVLAPVLEKINTVIQTLKEKWDALDPKTKETIMKVGLIVAAIGPVVTIIGGVISVIGTVISVAGSLIGVIGTIVAVIGGPLTLIIGAAIAIGVLLYKNWDKIKTKAAELRQKIAEAWENIKQKIVTTWNTIKSVTELVWTAIKTAITTKASEIKTTIQTKFNEAKQKITEALNNAKTKASEIMGNMKTAISTKAGEIKTAVGTKFEAIKDKIKEKMESAKTAVKTAIDKIKSFFNFSWKIPKPKLPSFSLKTTTKTFLGKTVTVPTGFSFDGWNRKAYDQPFLFTDPTIVNGRGFGDGPGSGEIVYGRDNLLKDIATAAGVDSNKMYQAVRDGASDANIKLVIGERELGRVLRQMGVVFAS